MIRTQKTEHRKQIQKVFLFVLMFYSLFSVLCSRSFADSAARTLESIPVQHSGRIKPFQSFARETAIDITGEAQFQGMNPTQMMWEWIANPESWNNRPMIQVPRMLNQDFASLMIVKGRVSPEIILNHKPFLDQAQAAWAKRQSKDKLTPAETERLQLYDKAISFQEVATGATPGFLAHPSDPRIGWLPLQAFKNPEMKNGLTEVYPAENIHSFLQAFEILTSSIQKKSELNAPAKNFQTSLKALHESRGVYLHSAALQQELLYDRLQPFGWAWKLYLLAGILFGVIVMMSEAKHLRDSSAFGFRMTSAIAMSLWGLGFLIHLLGFILRCLIAGRPPVTNMYESVIWVSWASVFFSIFIFINNRSFLIPMTACLVGAIALVIAESFPALMDPTIQPLVPVLRSNMWLTIHVLTITMSYGAFALGWGLGHVVVIGYVRDPYNIEAQRKLSNFLYRALQIGVILLAAGTVLGGVWANYSWGRFWGWDPKETWALIALLGYLVVLHGRYAGWLNSFHAAAASVIAFLGVVMAWYGVNYVLAAGLHSYGFGGGGSGYVLAAALIDLALILGLSFVYNRRRRLLSLRGSESQQV